MFELLCRFLAGENCNNLWANVFTDRWQRLCCFVRGGPHAGDPETRNPVVAIVCVPWAGLPTRMAERYSNSRKSKHRKAPAQILVHST